MCTLIVLHRCLAGKPLVVAANRDEFLARPAEGPAIREGRRGLVLSPLDLEAGGTWLGLNEHGVFVGLTNLRPRAAETMVAPTAGEAAKWLRDAERIPVVEGARSRGEVVTAALEARTAIEAVESIEVLEEGAYNPFQLLVADRNQAHLTVYHRRPETKPLLPGVHVVGNVVEDEENLAALGAAEQPRARKLARIRERVEKLTTIDHQVGHDLSDDVLDRLAEVCREHVDAEGSAPLASTDFRSNSKSGPGSADGSSAISPFESTCVHLADRYGTRSSFLLELAEAPESSRLWTTDGPPCEQPFVDMSVLLEELDRRSVAARAG